MLRAALSVTHLGLAAAWALTVLPAQATPISGTQSVQTFVVATGQSAEVLAGTSYDAPHRSYVVVQASGVLDVAGTFTARGDSEGPGLTSSGTVVNQVTGTLEAMEFANGGVFTNTGIARIGVYQGLSVVGLPGLSNSGRVENQGDLTVYLNSTNSGAIENDGTLRLSTNGAYTPVLSSQSDALSGTTATFINNGSGLIEIDFQASIENRARFVNAGQMTVSGEFRNLPKNGPFPTADMVEFLNGGSLVVGSSGVFRNQERFTNSGTVDVSGVFLHSSAEQLLNSAAGTFRVGFDPNSLTGGVLEVFGGSQVRNEGQFLVDGEVRAQAGSGTFINDGPTSRFEISSTGTVAANSFFLNDGELVVDGTLDTFRDAQGNGGLVEMTGGLLSGIGTINGDLFVGGGLGTATFTPGRSPGAFTINGNATFDSGSVLELEIQLDANQQLAWDSVSAQSMTFLSGSTVRLLIDPAAGSVQNLSLLACTSLCSFDPSVIFEIVGGDGVVDFDTNGLRITLSQVPEPATAALLLAGLSGLLLWSRPLRRDGGTRG